MDLFSESRALLAELERRELDYALAGALALAIHGVPRATADIDLLVPSDQIEPILEVARGLGFDLAAMPMRFADGLEIRRLRELERWRSGSTRPRSRNACERPAGSAP